MDNKLTICTSSSPQHLKRKRCISSSQEIVLDEEFLLALIMLRLPYRKLMSCKSVSKKWLSLITSTYFTRLLCDSLPSLRASGLFLQCPPQSGKIPDQVYFVSLDKKNTPSPFRTPAFAHDIYDPQKIRILQSCKGLLLCSSAFFNPRGECNGYVYNPSTNQLATLPKHPLGIGFGILLIGLTFDPLKSIHYRVIGLTTSRSGSAGDFYIYSSETETWRSSIQSYVSAPGMHFFGGVYWKGCMYWLSELHTSSEPESSVSDCLYLNVDEERLGAFPRPPIVVRSSSRRSLYFGESEDHLHVIEVCPYDTSLSVYEMKSDYSEWFVKYQIDLDPISKVFPEMTKHKYIFRDKSDYAVAVLSLIRRENFREDSFVVLEIPGKAIRYNLVDRSFEVVWDFSVDFGLTKIGRWPFGRFQVSQYVEPVPCVYSSMAKPVDLKTLSAYSRGL
ncbi:F-box domain-containing protein [Heracleum sosnowskyi]|uniref:F-box domain-containing protein n=1 Tax=Heracleum sosnowskyi TaxID=360622 RepID=A0AAD8M808_9APIA|nr:F-box domain-containing protein [Heracleum sosnowskyi]